MRIRSRVREFHRQRPCFPVPRWSFTREENDMTFNDLYELFIATAQDPSSEEELEKFLILFKQIIDNRND